MIPGLGYLPPGPFAARAAGGIQVVDLGTTNDTGTDATITLAFGSFGTEAAGRKLVCGVSAMDGATVFSLSTPNSIGGIAASAIGRDSGQTYAGLLSADVPTGASGSAIMTLSETLTNDQQGALIAVYGAAAGAPANSDETADDGVTSITRSVSSVLPGHLVVVCCAKRASAQAFASITDTGVSTNPWNEVENLAPPDGGARLGMWWKIFEADDSAGVDVTVTGGATATEYAICYQRFAPA